MTRSEIFDITDVMDQYGSVYYNYSGRGMYGEGCIGVMLEQTSDIYNLMFDVYDETGYRMPAPHEDAMGMEKIYYWPGLKLPDREEV